MSDGGWELITCSRAVKIIDECVFNPQKENGGADGGAGMGGERGGGRRGRERGREGVVVGEGGWEVGKVLISAL